MKRKMITPMLCIGQLEMCDFVGLMEQVEYIGKEIVY